MIKVIVNLVYGCGTGGTHHIADRRGKFAWRWQVGYMEEVGPEPSASTDSTQPTSPRPIFQKGPLTIIYPEICEHGHQRLHCGPFWKYISY